MIFALAAQAGILRAQDPPDGLDAAFGARRVALVVGIDRYDDPVLGDLKYAAKDADDLAAVLRDPERGDYDVVSLEAGTVTKEAFWSAFTAVASGLQRDDTLLVYVASHGTLGFGVEGTELMLLPSDGWLADPGTTIEVSAIASAIEALPARRKVLVLDACHAGMGRSVLAPDIKRKIEGFRGPIPAPPALSVSAFSAHLYAAHLHQPAIEDPTLQNGVYTHFLIEGLSGAADTDGDGLIEVMEAHDFARDQTLSYTGGTQVPWAEVVSVGRASVFLAGDRQRRLASEHAILTGLEALPAQAEVRVDGLARGAGALQEGMRRIEITEAGEPLASVRLRVAPGDAVHLGEILSERAPSLRLTAGLGAALDRRWLGAPLGAVGLEALPRDVSGVRPALLLLMRAGPGPALAPGGPFPSGSLEATVGPLWSAGPWSAGPSLGLGALWRLAPSGAQGAPLASGGGRLSWSHSRWLLAADARLPLFRADGSWIASPYTALSTGLRW